MDDTTTGKHLFKRYKCVSGLDGERKSQAKAKEDCESDQAWRILNSTLHLQACSVRSCTFDTFYPPYTYLQHIYNFDMSVEKRKDSPSLPGGGSAIVKRARSDEQDDSSKTLILSSERSGTSNAVVGTVCFFATTRGSVVQQLTVPSFSHDLVFRLSVLLVYKHLLCNLLVTR